MIMGGILPTNYNYVAWNGDDRVANFMAENGSKVVDLKYFLHDKETQRAI